MALKAISKIIRQPIAAKVVLALCFMTINKSSWKVNHHLHPYTITSYSVLAANVGCFVLCYDQAVSLRLIISSCLGKPSRLGFSVKSSWNFKGEPLALLLSSTRTLDTSDLPQDSKLPAHSNLRALTEVQDSQDDTHGAAQERHHVLQYIYHLWLNLHWRVDACHEDYVIPLNVELTNELVNHQLLKQDFIRKKQNKKFIRNRHDVHLTHMYLGA